MAVLMPAPRLGGYALDVLKSKNDAARGLEVEHRRLGPDRIDPFLHARPFDEVAVTPIGR